MTLPGTCAHMRMGKESGQGQADESTSFMQVHGLVCIVLLEMRGCPAVRVVGLAAACCGRSCAALRTNGALWFARSGLKICEILTARTSPITVPSGPRLRQAENAQALLTDELAELTAQLKSNALGMQVG